MRYVKRERLSPAESSFEQKLCEVRPGVGPVKKIIDCVLKKSGTADIFRLLRAAGGVFL